MRREETDFINSEDEFFQFRRNSLNSNYLHEEGDSDQKYEKTIGYFSDKLNTLEKSYNQRQIGSKTSMPDLIKTLFK
jgi:hypothetical protein